MEKCSCDTSYSDGKTGETAFNRTDQIVEIKKNKDLLSLHKNVIYSAIVNLDSQIFEISQKFDSAQSKIFALALHHFSTNQIQKIKIRKILKISSAELNYSIKFDQAKNNLLQFIELTEAFFDAFDKGDFDTCIAILNKSKQENLKLDELILEALEKN